MPFAEIDFTDPAVIMGFIMGVISDGAFLGILGVVIPGIGLAILMFVLLAHYFIGIVLLAMFIPKLHGWLAKLVFVLSVVLPLPLLVFGLIMGVILSNKAVAFITELALDVGIAIATAGAAVPVEGAVAGTEAAVAGGEVAVTAGEVAVQGGGAVAQGGEVVAKGAEAAEKTGEAARKVEKAYDYAKKVGTVIDKATGEEREETPEEAARREQLETMMQTKSEQSPMAVAAEEEFTAPEPQSKKPDQKAT